MKKDADLGGQMKTGRDLYSLSLKHTRLIRREKEYQENKSKLSFLKSENTKRYRKSHPTQG